VPEIENPPNSEVSKPFLEICAGTPAAVQDMQFALQKDEHGHFQRIQYEKVFSSFKLSEFVSCAPFNKNDSTIILFITFLYV